MIQKLHKMKANMLVTLDLISSWKSKGLSDETITPYATSDNSLTPWMDHHDTKIRLKLNKSCLKQSIRLHMIKAA